MDGTLAIEMLKTDWFIIVEKFENYKKWKW